MTIFKGAFSGAGGGVVRSLVDDRTVMLGQTIKLWQGDALYPWIGTGASGWLAATSAGVDKQECGTEVGVGVGGGLNGEDVRPNGEEGGVEGQGKGRSAARLGGGDDRGFQLGVDVVGVNSDGGGGGGG